MKPNFPAIFPHFFPLSRSFSTFLSVHGVGLIFRLLSIVFIAEFCTVISKSHQKNLFKSGSQWRIFEFFINPHRTLNSSSVYKDPMKVKHRNETLPLAKDLFSQNLGLNALLFVQLRIILRFVPDSGLKKDYVNRTAFCVCIWIKSKTQTVVLFGLTHVFTSIANNRRSKVALRFFFSFP